AARGARATIKASPSRRALYWPCRHGVVPILYSPNWCSNKLMWRAVRQVLKFSQSPLRGPDEEFEAAFSAMTNRRGDAAVIQGSLSTKRMADLALKHRLPAASTTRGFVDAGGLMSYGADGPAMFRHSARFVQRILQGRQPNDLPIEQPTKFELAVNLRTAKAMALTIPESFLLRADALIE